ncbi:MAG: ankyrin repeat domain-containing protein [Alphaproteobacteria bacterium CG_4_9_14_3_um_filter_47_13]|nr:MAG: ankyrin repeat domain-containing protein [Alphaproteobacteria bacterium CG_4_9_14_3_um_filter_47_13]
MQDNRTNELAKSRLWRAAEVGDCKTIRLLAMEGIDIDARNEDGFTAFNIATQNNHSDAAMTILAAREMQFAQDLGEEPAAFYKITMKTGTEA